jgi:hypothetical protein
VAITIPVEGFNFPIREKFDVQGATVESHLNIDNKMEPMISVDVYAIVIAQEQRVKRAIVHNMVIHFWHL